MSDKDTARVQMRSVIAFFSGNLGATVLTLVATLMVTRWTPPHQLGLWNLMTVFISYASVLQLGVFNAMNRQIPFFRGSGDTAQAELAGRVGWAWCLGLTAVTLLVGLAAVGYFAAWGSRDQMLTAIAFIVVLAGSWSMQWLTVSYTTTGAFGTLARKTTLIAAAGLPLALLAQAMGYVGLLLRAGLVALIGIATLGHQRPLSTSPAWDGAMFRQLVRVGLPIWLLGQLGGLFMTMDRLVLADSPELLGYYAIAAQFAALAVMVPTAFNAVLYPQMARNFGQFRSAMALWRQALRASLGMFAAGAAFAGICWMSIPAFVSMLLPAYLPAVEAARWTSMAAVAMTFSVFGNVLNVLGRQDVYLVSSAVGGITFVLTWMGLSTMSDGSILVAAAQSMLLATLATSLTAMILSLPLCARIDRAASTVSKSMGSV